MPLEHLPAELLHAICEACPNHTLQDLRLTCRRLKAVSDEHFFPEVVTCLERGELASVHNVTLCDANIRNSVKAFTIQADGCNADLDEFRLSPQEWFLEQKIFLNRSRSRILDVAREAQKRRSAPHRARLAQACLDFLLHLEAQGEDKNLRNLSYQTYKELWDDQLRLFEDNTARATFDALFKACPKILAITINHKHILRCNAGMSSPLYLASTTIPHGGNKAFVAKAVLTMLPAACDANLEIRDLAIAGASPDWMCVSLAGRPSRQAPKVLKCYQVLQHVQRLHLVFNGADVHTGVLIEHSDYSYISIADVFHCDALIDWLKNCPELRELRLAMPIEEFVLGRVRFRHILGELHLGNLTVLHVMNFQAKSEDLVHGLLRHKDTLQELDLKNVHLTDGNWPACIAHFAGKLPRLRRARMTGPLTSDYRRSEDLMACFIKAKEHQEELEKYILDGMGEMPTWTAAEMADHDHFEYENDEDEDEDDEDEFDHDREHSIDDFFPKNEHRKNDPSEWVEDDETVGEGGSSHPLSGWKRRQRRTPGAKKCLTDKEILSWSTEFWVRVDASSGDYNAATATVPESTTAPLINAFGRHSSASTDTRLRDLRICLGLTASLCVRSQAPVRTFALLKSEAKREPKCTKNAEGVLGSKKAMTARTKQKVQLWQHRCTLARKQHIRVQLSLACFICKAE